MSTSGDVSIGVDIGGTFTDVVVRHPGARTRIMKIPSTRKDPSVAVLEAVKQMEAEWGFATTAGRPLRARYHGCDQRGA
jgi:N-methylhydantoinase A